jgi:flagellar motor switch protein FliN/FliY
MNDPLSESAVRALVAAPVRLSAEIGRRLMPVNEVLQLSEGELVELDSAAEDPADLYVNGRRLGAGKLVLVDGEWALQIEWLAGDDETNVVDTSAEYEGQ